MNAIILFSMNSKRVIADLKQFFPNHVFFDAHVHGFTDFNEPEKPDKIMNVIYESGLDGAIILNHWLDDYSKEEVSSIKKEYKSYNNVVCALESRLSFDYNNRIIRTHVIQLSDKFVYAHPFSKKGLIYEMYRLANKFTRKEKKLSIPYDFAKKIINDFNIQNLNLCNPVCEWMNLILRLDINPLLGSDYHPNSSKKVGLCGTIIESYDGFNEDALDSGLMTFFDCFWTEKETVYYTKDSKINIL